MRIIGKPMSIFPQKWAVACGAVALMATGIVGTAAQAGELMQLENVANIQVTESVSAQQDWLTITLNATVRGKEAKATQNQLNVAVRKALDVLNKKAAKGKLEASSGDMNMYFQHSDKFSSKSGGNAGVWQGSAQVVVQGGDFDRILGTVGDVQTMTVQNMQFGLSPATRHKAGEQAKFQAIKAFGKEAQEVSTAFGFKSYALREVHVGNQGAGAPVYMQRRAQYGAEAGADVAGQAGQENVSATVRGSIQMK